MYFNCCADCCFGCGDECQVKTLKGERKKEANKAFFVNQEIFFWEQLTEETLFWGGTEATDTLLQIIDICNSIATFCCQGIE